MGLEFQNYYAKTLYVAFIYGDKDCGVKFRKQGWWAVNPGQTRTVWNVNLQTVNRYAYFFAEEFKDGGGATWTGSEQRFYRVPNVEFNQCLDDQTNCSQQPNFVPLDFDNADNGNHQFHGIKVTLGPEPGRIRTKGWVPID